MPTSTRPSPNTAGCEQGQTIAPYGYNGYALDINQGNTSPGTRILVNIQSSTLRGQCWIVEPLGTTSLGFPLVRLTNSLRPSSVLAFTDAGVVLADKSQDTGQQWWLAPSDIAGKSYIHNLKVSDCLTAPGTSAPLTVQSCDTGRSTQIWAVDPTQ